MHFPKKTMVVDANVVLRYLLRDHEKLYKEAEALFNEAFSGKSKIFLLDSVVAEVVYVLSGLYKVKREEIAQVLMELLKGKGINATDKDVLFEALKIFGLKNLDFVDCLICAYSRKFPVISFDKKVKKCVDEISKVKG